MAFIGRKVPPAVAAALSKIPVPDGKKLSPDEMHVTLLYLGKGIPLVTALGAVMGCGMVAKRWAPFKAHAAVVTSFPPGEDGTPVIVRVVSQRLMELQAEVKKAMERMSVPFSDKWPDYKPHVTLTYAGEPVRPRPVEDVSATSWEVRDLVVWGGEEMNEGVVSTVHFG